jgi:hypothetical protein
MSFEPPVQASRTEYTVRVQDLEGILRPPETASLIGKLYQPKLVNLKEGTQLIIRPPRRDEIPQLLKAIRPYMDVNKDFYDLVGVRTYAEILAWQQYRIKDHHCLVGVVGDELVGLVNFRMWDEKIAISLHTMSFKRGIDVGPALYFAKAEYGLDVLGAEEWWVTFESYIGLRVLGIEWAAQQKPWPRHQHELGGARVFYITRDAWQNFHKVKYARYMGERPPPKDLLEKSQRLRIPEKVDV